MINKSACCYFHICLSVRVRSAGDTFFLSLKHLHISLYSRYLLSLLNNKTIIYQNPLIKITEQIRFEDILIGFYFGIYGCRNRYHYFIFYHFQMRSINWADEIKMFCRKVFRELFQLQSENNKYTDCGASCIVLACLAHFMKLNGENKHFIEIEIYFRAIEQISQMRVNAKDGTFHSLLFLQSCKTETQSTNNSNHIFTPMKEMSTMLMITTSTSYLSNIELKQMQKLKNSIRKQRHKFISTTSACHTITGDWFN